jgi:hypothetical protein
MKYRPSRITISFYCVGCTVEASKTAFAEAGLLGVKMSSARRVSLPGLLSDCSHSSSHCSILYKALQIDSDGNEGFINGMQ